MHCVCRMRLVRHIARQTLTPVHLAVRTSSTSPPTSAPPAVPAHNKQTEYFRQLISASLPDVDETPLTDIRPALLLKSRTLAPYVGESETLQRLVRLGVSLWRVEKDTEVSSGLLRANFSADIEPRIQWLQDCGVPTDQLGSVISASPRLLTESLDLLQSRVDYLKSKRFDAESIVRIISKAPLFLSKTTKEVDRQLGYFQRKFHLSGDELRLTVTRLPKLFIWSSQSVEKLRRTMDGSLGFTAAEQKQLLIAMPKIYLSSNRNLCELFDFVHNEMGLSHEVITQWPSILRTRLFIVKQRHLFLRHLERAQYDPAKPNYVGLGSMVACRDAQFCEEIAKVPIREFNDFLKTL